MLNGAAVTRLLVLFLTLPALLGSARAAVDPELRQKLIVAIEETESFDDRFDAEVWLVDMSNRLQRSMPDTDERLDFLKLVHREASRVDLPPELVLAVIEVESNFD